MRLTSDFFVAQLMRRVALQGCFATIIKKGSAEAGAVFVTVRLPSGHVDLFAPAPQQSYSVDRPSERLFSKIETMPNDEAVSSYMTKETRFDPDLWLVELEIDTARFELPFEVTRQ